MKRTLLQINRIIKSRLSLANSQKTSLFSTSNRNLEKYKVSFIPRITSGSKIIVPISMGRYVINEKKKKEYDEILESLFSQMAYLLDTQQVNSVDILSTAGLQRINWDKGLVEKVEAHFLNRHNTLLEKQSNCYKWEEWIEEQGNNIFENNYQFIKQKSQEGTEWHKLMVKTHQNVEMSSDLNRSLEYQKREYAAIMLMNGYDNLVYPGISPIGLSYMYHALRTPLPTFTRANFEKNSKNESVISVADASHTTKIIVNMLEDTLASQNFPIKEKERIIDKSMSLFYAHGPKTAELLESSAHTHDKGIALKSR